MLIRLMTAIGIAVITIVVAEARELHLGFVYLADLVPSIRQDMRYAGSHNFLGRPVNGYEANECILTEQAARALVKVQAELALRKLSLIVWDCYRPSRAVRDFVAWSKVPADARMRAEFYPNTKKERFIQLGYLAAHSAHSRGSTVDVGIMPSDVSPPGFDPTFPLKPCTAPKGQRFEDGTIDLGTEHDCFDVQSSTSNPNVPEEAQTNRLTLQRVMQRSGFSPYAREWWHFQLKNEPFPDEAFDFPVVARGASDREKAPRRKTDD
jgi:D-alanyl-D-alanine dipeptidase